MLEDAIIVSTYKNLEQMQQDGGCGHWPLGTNPARAQNRGAKYVVCIRNRNGYPKPPPNADHIEHGRPFLIGKLLPEAMPVDLYTENGVQRQLLLMSEIAALPPTLPLQQATENFYYGSISDLGIKLNELTFQPFIKSVRQEPVAAADIGKNDYGPEGDGTRSEAIWSARQRPIAIKLVAELEKKGWSTCDGKGWKPDILMRDAAGRRILIEVKPDCGLHNLITGLGQILCYREPHGDTVISIVAAEASAEPSIRVDAIFERYAIHLLNLANATWRTELNKLIA